MKLEYFQMVDKIVDLNLAERTIAVEANVPPQSTVFEGHFPGYPLMPGVLLIESMAQTSGWLITALMKFERMPFLAAVKEAKMRIFVTPGERMRIDAKLAHDGSGFAVIDARITVAGKLACNATLTLRHMPFPNDDLRAHMTCMAEKLGLSREALVND